jgi:hypothetical protein
LIIWRAGLRTWRPGEQHDYEARPTRRALDHRPVLRFLLITENKTVLLDLGCDGKFVAKSNAWEENKVVLEGEEIVIRVSGGRCFIVKRPAQGAMIGPGTPTKAEAPAPEADDVL